METESPIEFHDVHAMARDGQPRSNRRRRSRGTADVAASNPKREKVSDADDNTGSHGPPPNPTKKPRYLDVEEGEELEEETLIDTPLQRALPRAQSNSPEPQNAEEHNVPARIIVSVPDADLYQLFGYCAACDAGGEAGDWHLDVSGFPCRRLELQDAFRTGNAFGVVKSLHRFMSESLRRGHGRLWGLNANYTSIWLEEYRRRLLPWIGKLTSMGTYDCLSLAYRLLWKLKDLPQEPHLDEIRKARSDAGDVTSISLLPQDNEIDDQMYNIIRRRAMNGEKWAWEHDLAALDKQASLLTEPTSTQWFCSSRRALGDLGKQREGLTSEFLEPLPGFQYAMALNVGALGLRTGVHCACCAHKVDQLEYD
ncbi:hypothetical protein QBC45DRAFT_413504 [Copromyces sp. CBS 386.78]|nr:hypothetical protein QBC45DRAFT_413504 [Copromyces sp. CBS 386.78]